MAVPNIFGTATAAIPLSQLDQNFATAITLGNTAVYLGNTTTSLGNVTLTNVTISSGNVSVSTATVGAGSNTAPSITTTGDTNTGIFFPAADTIAFAEGGAEAMRIDSSGNVGIGTSSPSSYGLLTIKKYSTSAPPYFVLENRGANTTDASTYTQGGMLFTGYRDTNDPAYIASITVSRTSQSGGASSAGDIVFGTSTTPTGSIPTERMRIDSSGNVGIGTSSPAYPLTLGNNKRFGSLNTAGAGVNFAILDNSNNLTFGDDSANTGTLTIQSRGDTKFVVNTAERMRITDTGNLLVGKTSASGSTAGAQLEPSGLTTFVRSGGVVLQINRLANDGNLVDFYQDTVLEGNISVSGTTVSYNGGHLSRWAQMLTKPDLLKGTVMSNLDEMNEYVDADGNPVPNEQLNKVKVSDIEGDANVAGVFVNWTHDEAHDVDEINMAMTGDMIIRIAQGTTVQRGDLLISAGDGTAKPQGDDIVRSKTVAKVTSTHVTCTYADGSYCVPCVLMAC